MKDSSTEFLEETPQPGNLKEKLLKEHTRISAEQAAPDARPRRGRPAGYRKVNGEWVKQDPQPAPGPTSAAEPVPVQPSIDEAEGMKLILGLIIVIVLGVDLTDKELEYGAKLHLLWINKNAPAVIKDNKEHGYIFGFWSLVLMKTGIFGSKNNVEIDTPEKTGTEEKKEPPAGFQKRSSGPGPSGNGSNGKKGTHEFF